MPVSPRNAPRDTPRNKVQPTLRAPCDPVARTVLSHRPRKCSQQQDKPLLQAVLPLSIVVNPSNTEEWVPPLRGGESASTFTPKWRQGLFTLIVGRHWVGNTFFSLFSMALLQTPPVLPQPCAPVSGHHCTVVCVYELCMYVL